MLVSNIQSHFEIVWYLYRKLLELSSEYPKSKRMAGISYWELLGLTIGNIWNPRQECLVSALGITQTPIQNIKNLHRKMLKLLRERSIKNVWYLLWELLEFPLEMSRTSKFDSVSLDVKTHNTHDERFRNICSRYPIGRFGIQVGNIWNLRREYLVSPS